MLEAHKRRSVLETVYKSLTELAEAHKRQRIKLVKQRLLAEAGGGGSHGAGKNADASQGDGESDGSCTSSAEEAGAGSAWQPC